VDSLNHRGLHERFQDRAAVAIPSAAHFALIPLDLGKLGDVGLRGVFIQQAATEEILRGHAQELGVEIRAGFADCGVGLQSVAVHVLEGSGAGSSRLRSRHRPAPRQMMR
jgi:hypothetical protein